MLRLPEGLPGSDYSNARGSVHSPKNALERPPPPRTRRVLPTHPPVRPPPSLRDTSMYLHSWLYLLRHSSVLCTCEIGFSVQGLFHTALGTFHGELRITRESQRADFSHTELIMGTCSHFSNVTNAQLELFAFLNIEIKANKQY